LDVRFSEGISPRILPSSVKRFMVVLVEEGVKRDAPNNGTHTALSYGIF
jgi:hypothetical protein